MEILTAEGIRAAEKAFFTQSGTPSFELMQRAASTFAQRLMQLVQADKKITILAGTGNNGGDGVGVALHLHQAGYQVLLLVAATSSKPSDDFMKYLDLAKAASLHYQEINELPKDLQTDVMVDALFGIGLSRSVEGRLAKLISDFNSIKAFKVALDIPTGLLADRHTEGNNIARCHLTLTYQWPKPIFMLPESGEYVGNFELLDIGIGQYGAAHNTQNMWYVDADVAKSIYKPRKKFTHKGHYGHTLIVAGSKGKMGAAVLCARAALHAGAGLVTVHTPSVGYTIIQTSVPEAMCQEDIGTDYTIGPIDNHQVYHAVGIGPGLDQHHETADALSQFLEQYNRPVVLDADGINLAATHAKLLHNVPHKSIFTPHPKEFERLAGPSKNSFDRLSLLKQFATQHNCVIVLKDAHTAICTPDGRLYFNSTGNPGMATAGSGDALTGIITALLSQGYEPAEAAILGVYVHGLAGDLAKAEHGAEYLTASDIITYLGKAFLTLH